MMDTKLLMALCALLVPNSVFADQENQGALSPNPAMSPGAAEANVTASSLDPTSHAGSSSSTNQPSTSSENQTISTPLSSVKDNETEVSAAVTGVSDKNENSTNQLPPQPPTVPSESLSPTSHASLPPSITSIKHIAHTTPVPFTTPSSLNPSVSLTPGSTTHSKQERPPQTTSTLKPEPQNPTISSTTTTANTQLNSTSSTSSSHSTSSLHLTTETSQMISHDKTSSTSQPKPTVTPLSKTSTQAKTHSGNPSQLNVGGDTMMAHDSQTLDPLLAGLVSAFIVTAVIIVLLLFLKLRRRDNRPQFRRLQDLPMDDMMEDTPLSMYSY